MKKSTAILILIILSLLFALFGIILNQEKEIIYKIDTIKIVKINDSLIPYEVEVPKDSFIYKKIFLHDTILQIDTITKFVTEFLAVNHYSDTILNDSSGKIIINDLIHRNKIIHRESKIDIYRKIQQQNNYLVAGTYLRTQDNRLNIGLNLTYEQQKNVFGVGVDKNSFIVSYGRKIRIKRKNK